MDPKKWNVDLPIRPEDLPKILDLFTHKALKEFAGTIDVKTWKLKNDTIQEILQSGRFRFDIALTAGKVRLDVMRFPNVKVIHMLGDEEE